MRWPDVVAAYPNQWLVIEAVESRVETIAPVSAALRSRTPSAGPWTPRRVLERVRVIELCADGRCALHVTREYQRAHPTRIMRCVHTSYPSLEFDEPLAAPRASCPSLELPVPQLGR